MPIILAIAAALLALVTLGPVAAAVLLLRSSSDAAGRTLGAYVAIGAVVLALCAAAGLVGWVFGRMVLRVFGWKRQSYRYEGDSRS